MCGCWCWCRSWPCVEGEDLRCAHVRLPGRCDHAAQSPRLAGLLLRHCKHATDPQLMLHALLLLLYHLPQLAAVLLELLYGGRRQAGLRLQLRLVLQQGLQVLNVLMQARLLMPQSLTDMFLHGIYVPHVELALQRLHHAAGVQGLAAGAAS